MFAPQTTFGPHLVVAPDGTFVLYFRVNLLVNATLCAGAGHDPLPNATTLAASLVPPTSLVSGDPEKGTSIWVAWAKSFAGPWGVARVNITGGDRAKRIDRGRLAAQPAAPRAARAAVARGRHAARARERSAGPGAARERVCVRAAAAVTRGGELRVKQPTTREEPREEPRKERAARDQRGAGVGCVACNARFLLSERIKTSLPLPFCYEKEVKT